MLETSTLAATTSSPPHGRWKMARPAWFPLLSTTPPLPPSRPKTPLPINTAPTAKPSNNKTSTAKPSNCKTLELLEILRRETPTARHLIVTGDGSYTNKTVLRGKPAGSTYICRGRKDIAPLGYRLRNGSRMLYRQPAYLICTDPDLPLEKLLQYDLWRWGIEVNFREEA